MAMKFYGQFEPPVDQFIYERYFIGRKTRGVLIECGAFDGITECSGNFFEETLDWACVNVEPYPPAFAKLVVNRPKSTNINLALSSTSTSVEFTAVVHPVFGEDCNNGSISHTARHRQDLDNIGCSYRTYRVATTTYSELVSKLKLVTIDLLVLDVEGHEPEVLKGMQQTPHSLHSIVHGHDHVLDEVGPVAKFTRVLDQQRLLREQILQVVHHERRQPVVRIELPAFR